MKVRAEVAWPVAKELVAALEPACERIEIAGSLRRRRPVVGDIEILCIPKYRGLLDLLDTRVKELIAEGVLDYRLNKLGSKVYGAKNKLLMHQSGIGVDIFCTTEECWAVALVVRTGGEATNREIASLALARGMRFHAYGSGFTLPDGSQLVCHSEKEVFSAVGLRYQEPWERR